MTKHIKTMISINSLLFVTSTCPTHTLLSFTLSYAYSLQSITFIMVNNLFPMTSHNTILIIFHCACYVNRHYKLPITLLILNVHLAPHINMGGQALRQLALDMRCYPHGRIYIWRSYLCTVHAVGTGRDLIS